MGLIRKKADWVHADFVAHWRNRHGPIAARMPNLREYWQNLVIDRMPSVRGLPCGTWDFDGFSQLWFGSPLQAKTAATDSDFARTLIADEQYFLSTLHIVTAEQAVILSVPEPPRRGALSKRMSLLKRRPELTGEEFSRAWTAHAGFVQEIDGVVGYRQNLVTARERIKGQPCGYDELPIDGIVELWFDDRAAMEAAFASHAGQRSTEHAGTFVIEITSFLVVEHRVV
jgi:uncharacterized protein (TIGR02118 family)